MGMKVKDVDALREQISKDPREAFTKHQVWLFASEHNKTVPTIEAIPKADYAARLKADTTEKFKEFRDKLSKWMFHNSESVCGCSMIDIDYLEGHMDELLYELGIYEVNEDDT